MNLNFSTQFLQSLGKARKQSAGHKLPMDWVFTPLLCINIHI